MSKVYANFAQVNGTINNGANNNTVEWIRLKGQSFWGAASQYDFVFTTERDDANCEVWMITWQQLQNTTDNVNINMRFSTDGGSTFPTTGRLVQYWSSSDNQHNTNFNNAGECVIHRGAGNDLWSRGFGQIECLRRGRDSADAHFRYISHTWYAANSGMEILQGAYAKAGGDHDAVRFIPVSGSLDQLEVTLWGKYIANTNHNLHT